MVFDLLKASEISLPLSFEARKNRLYQQAVFSVESGGDLLSRAVTSQVPSALKGLTSVFGMGTGVTPSLSPPEMVIYSVPHPDNCTAKDSVLC